VKELDGMVIISWNHENGLDSQQGLQNICSFKLEQVSEKSDGLGGFKQNDCLDDLFKMGAARSSRQDFVG
jgi:hypothetical protein